MPNNYIKNLNTLPTGELGGADRVAVYDSARDQEYQVSLTTLAAVVGGGGGGGLVDGDYGDITVSGSATVFSIDAGVITNTHVNASAGIVDTKLATISTAGKVSNSATTATSANTASAIVARDASGNFTAGTITATLFSGSGASLTSLSGTQITSGTVPPAQLGSGSSITTKYLRGDSTWQTISGGGDALTSGNLSQFAATTSAQLLGVISDETGTGALVFATSPTLVTPLLGTPTSGNLSNCTALNATQLTTGTVPDARFPATLPAASGVNLTALNASNLASGTVGTARLGTGSASSSTYLRGDSTWAAVASSYVDGVVGFKGELAPDASGNCFWQESSVNNSNDLAPTSQVLCFKNAGSALIAAYADGVPVPANFDGTKTTTVTIGWRTTATSGNVVWNARYRSIADGESNDPSSWQESLAATAAAPGTARLIKYTTMTMTAANLAAGDSMLWLIGRDKSSGSDTLAADVEVVSVKYEY